MSYRDTIILEIYRSIRDAINSFSYVKRQKNTVILHHDGKRVTVSFRVKVEDIELADAHDEQNTD